MPITVLDCLEIFTHPFDLVFCVGQDKGTGKWGVWIGRGRGHRYKPILTSPHDIESKEQAIQVIEGALESVIEAARKCLNETKNPVGGLLRPADAAIDESAVLQPALIARILAELRKNPDGRGDASTEEMKECAA